MLVSDIQLRRSGSTQELSGLLGNFRLWMRFPAECRISARGDAFLTMALFPAMALGEPLEIEQSAPVSPTLLDGVERLQEIFHCWEPLLRKISIKATAVEPEGSQDSVGVFFSGGVDASYTLKKHADEVTHLIFIRGFDIPYDDMEVFATAQQQYEAFAKSVGKKLVYVETNRQQLNRELLMPLIGKKADFTHQHIVACRSQAYGSIMASVGLALGLRKYYVGTGGTYGHLQPYAGYHPLTEPCWSTGATRFIHDGLEAERSAKLEAIASDCDLMKFLRVCRRGGQYNCGACAKCLRTMATLRLLGRTAPTLPALRSLRPLHRISVCGTEDLVYFKDNLRLAQRQGDKALAAILRRKVLEFHLKQHLKLTDRLLFRGTGVHWLRRSRGAPAASAREQAPLPS